ncbi:MAG: ABC transporter substrate-binding protein [Candidatus Limnocylindria bacterium]
MRGRLRGEERPVAEREPTAATRTVEHALGTSEIPADPRRIVVLNQYSLLDYLLLVEVTPVGSTGDPAADYPYGHWLEGMTEGVEMVGGTEEPNLEKIAALKPDLILANPWQEDVHDELAAIAPTVAVPLTYRDYQEEFRYVAGLVGREQEAEQVIARHRARLEAFKAKMGERLQGLEVSVARVFPDQIRVEGSSSGYVPFLFERAGLRRPKAHLVAEGLELSLEQLAKIDADVLFVYSAANAELEPENAKARQALERHPLWSNLRAVKNDRAYIVDSFLWAGGGMLWAERVLDDLFRYLLEGKP